ncbi:hypothetical protein FHQ08_07755 [Lactobacillus sp. CC-MHH1034]|uniref:DUF3329 domain-containing protein n=1 Tax=Agrilactobacillus fermenti TaxID=2586909 RepID=UPI001E5256BC|nr:DUF6056 family protein [Agrilactobacillus fermenti]MCD2256613.1 hypothetical protein [Agrilactobacillus fermenti]
MNTTAKRFKQKWIYLIFILSFGLMGALNFLTPLYDDDLYMYHRYHSFWSILDVANYEYHNWNGRAVGQTIFRSLLNIPWPAFKILNALAFCALTFLILLYTSKNWQKLSPIKYLAILAASWLFLPAFGQSVLWAAGSGNYLWTTLLILCLALPYFIKAFHIQRTPFKHHLKPAIRAILIIFLGILAGWSNENTSGGLIMAIGLMMIYQLFVKKTKLALWQYTGFAATVFGFLMLLRAPGNQVRTIATVGKAYLKIPFLQRFSTGIWHVSDSMNKLHMPFVWTLLAAIIVLFIFWPSLERIVKTLLWTAVGAATLYALGAAPTAIDGGRAFFGGMVFGLIALFSAIPDSFEFQTIKWKRGLILLANLAIIISALFNFYPGFMDLYRSNAAIKTRYSYIEQQVAKGHTHLKVPPMWYYPTTKYAINYNSQDLGKDPKVFPNDGYPVYFKGLKSIVRPR